MKTTTENQFSIGTNNYYYCESLPQAGVVENDAMLPVLCMSGLVSQAYSWRNVLPSLAEQGFRTIALDWPGCGYSDKPDPLDFAYSPENLVTWLGHAIDQLSISRCAIVTQGFLGTVATQYALRHPDRVERLAIFNSPIGQAVQLPWKIKQLSLPLLGEAFVQNPLLVDRLLEGAGGYRVEDADMDIYRRPWIRSSDAGRALYATLRRLDLAQVNAEIGAGLGQWTQPLLIGWGDRDPWLPLNQAEATAKTYPSTQWVAFQEVGHYVQEDWHEKVSEALIPFLRRTIEG